MIDFLGVSYVDSDSLKLFEVLSYDISSNPII